MKCAYSIFASKTQNDINSINIYQQMFSKDIDKK